MKRAYHNIEKKKSDRDLRNRIYTLLIAGLSQKDVCESLGINKYKLYRLRLSNNGEDQSITQRDKWARITPNDFVHPGENIHTIWGWRRYGDLIRFLYKNKISEKEIVELIKTYKLCSRATTYRILKQYKASIESD
jgi:hypothetical protein